MKHLQYVRLKQNEHRPSLKLGSYLAWVILNLVFIVSLSHSAFAAHPAIDWNRHPAAFPKLLDPELEEYQLGNQPAVILAYRNFQLGETLELKAAAGKSVSRTHASDSEDEDEENECRFHQYENINPGQAVTFTITGFYRASTDPSADSMENSNTIWIEGQLDGPLPEAPLQGQSVSDTYCRQKEKIRLTADELQELQGASSAALPAALQRLQQKIKKLGA